MIDLDQLIVQAQGMTPFRASTVRLVQLVTSQHCDLADIISLVAYDEVLTMKLLRAANCAARTGSVTVTTPYEAIVLLGTTLVLDLVVAAGVRPQLRGAIPGYGLDEGSLWRHSVAAAVAAETAFAFCSVEIPPEAFTASLLHDVGKVVMGRFLSPDILRFIEEAKEADQLTQMEAESQILHVHHGELGGLIAQHWQLPPRIVQGIIYHHNPEKGSDIVCDFACLANLVAKGIEAGLDGRSIECVLPRDVTARLGMAEGSVDLLRPVAASRFLEVSQRYNTL